MKKNIGLADRTARFGLAITIVALYFTHVITGILALVFMIVAGILIITSFFRFCPLYCPFKISTKKKIE